MTKRPGRPRKPLALSPEEVDALLEAIGVCLSADEISIREMEPTWRAPLERRGVLLERIRVRLSGRRG